MGIAVDIDSESEEKDKKERCSFPSSGELDFIIHARLRFRNSILHSFSLS